MVAGFERLGRAKAAFDLALSLCRALVMSESLFDDETGHKAFDHGIRKFSDVLGIVTRSEGVFCSSFQIHKTLMSYPDDVKELGVQKLTMEEIFTRPDLIFIGSGYLQAAAVNWCCKCCLHCHIHLILENVQSKNANIFRLWQESPNISKG